MLKWKKNVIISNLEKSFSTSRLVTLLKNSLGLNHCKTETGKYLADT